MSVLKLHSFSHSSPTLPVMIGMTGHCDHGKTALMKRLTDGATDNPKEDKERGVSAEVNYASCFLESGRVGVVDIPGQEKWVRKMAAGAAGLDIALLVVAADDGIMPQTREHFDILELLGIPHLLVALNKIDLVSAERVKAMSASVREFLHGTPYADAPILPVSAATGEGLSRLKQVLNDACRRVSSRKEQGVFRMAVDRVFSAMGHGTVATGVVLAGSVRIGDTVEVLPPRQTARVRSIQVHLADAGEGTAGQYAALHLSGIRRDEIERGCVLTKPGRFQCHATLAVRLCASRFLESPLLHSTRILFHSGTSERPGRIRLLEGEELMAGQETFAQIQLDDPAPVFLRDRFIIRLESTGRTVAGGVILNVTPHRCKRDHSETLEKLHNRWIALRSDLSLLLSIMDEQPLAPWSGVELALAAGLEFEEAQQALLQGISEGRIRARENQYIAASPTGQM